MPAVDTPNRNSFLKLMKKRLGFPSFVLIAVLSVAGPISSACADSVLREFSAEHFVSTRFGGIARGFGGYKAGRTLGARSSRASVTPPVAGKGVSVPLKKFSRKQASTALNKAMQRRLSGKFSKHASKKAYRSRSGKRYVRADLEAHHVVPYELRNHSFVKRARAGGFDFNGASNGVYLPRGVHQTGHQAYTARVKSTLDGIEHGIRGRSISDRQAASLLRNLATKEASYLQGAAGMY